jgi:hypothetical protein
VTLGRHFALTEADQKLLLNCSEDTRPEWIGKDLEERYEEPWICDTDKAWDAIHRAFDKSLLTYEQATPLHGVILGGVPLYYRTDYIISLKDENYVKSVAVALAQLSEGQFRELYYAIDQKEYGFPLDEDDFQYSWENLAGLKPFFENASNYKRSVIFTASQ